MTLPQKLRFLADQYEREGNLTNLRTGLLLVMDEVDQKQRDERHPLASKSETKYPNGGL